MGLFIFNSMIMRKSVPGLYPSPLNYMSFPKSLCVSVNEAWLLDTASAPSLAVRQVICHGIPDSRPSEDGDIVLPAMSWDWLSGPWQVNLDVSVCQGLNV